MDDAAAVLIYRARRLAEHVERSAKSSKLAEASGRRTHRSRAYSRQVLQAFCVMQKKSRPDIGRTLSLKSLLSLFQGYFASQ